MDGSLSDACATLMRTIWRTA